MTNSRYRALGPLVLSLCLCLCLLVSGCGSRPSPRRFEKAVAPNDFSVPVERRAEHAWGMEAHWRLIEEAEKRTQLRPLVTLYAQRLAERPNEADALFAWGYAVLRQYSSTRPQNAPQPVASGETDTALPKAAAALRRANQRAPARPEPYLALAVYQLMYGDEQIKKNKRIALNLVRLARKRAPNSSIVYEILAYVTEYRSDHPETAIPYYRKAITLDPTNTGPYWHIAAIYYNLGDRHRASLVFKALDRIAPAYLKADPTYQSYKSAWMPQ